MIKIEVKVLVVKTIVFITWTSRMNNKKTLNILIVIFTSQARIIQVLY